MRTPIEALKEIRDRLTYFCLRTDGKYDPPWATELVGIIDDILECKKNTDNPFYVDIGTSIVAIRCSSNHDVVHRIDHAYSKGSIAYLEKMCARMNEEVLGLQKPGKNKKGGVIKKTPKLDQDWKAICEKCHDGDILPDCEYFGEPNGCNSPIYGEHPKAKPVGNAAAMREALDDVLEKIDRWRTDGVMEHWQYSQLFDIAESALSAPARNCDIYKNKKDAEAAFISEECKHPLEAGNVKAIREALERLDALNLNVLKYPLDGDSSEIYDADKKPITLPAWGVATLLNGAKEAQVLAREALSSPPRNCDVGTAEEQTHRMLLYCKSHGVDESGCFRCDKCPFLTVERCELAWAQMPYEAQEGDGK